MPRGPEAEKAQRSIQEVVTACLRIQVLHAPHIAATADAEMDRIEALIRTQDSAALEAMEQLAEVQGVDPSPELDSALTAFRNLRHLTEQVLQLSRQNTNVKSAELSLGRMRLLSAQCQETLSALRKTVEAQGFKATR